MMHRDAPDEVEKHAGIIRRKSYLRCVYGFLYEKIMAEIPRELPGKVLELGSGGGFFRAVFPGAVATDVVFQKRLDCVCRAESLCFKPASLRAIVMLNVMHHISDPEAFFRAAGEGLVPGGRVIAIEPFPSPFSKFIYARIHHEPFDTKTPEWQLAGGGRMTGANGANAWNMMVRDRKRFETLLPKLVVSKVEPHCCFHYWISGGLSPVALAPGWAFPFVEKMENGIPGLNQLCASFATYIVERRLE